MAERKGKTCIGWTSRREFRNNLPCGNRAQPGSSYCRIHDPVLIEARDEARNKARIAKARGEKPDA